MKTTTHSERLIHTTKEMAVALTRSEDYVGDMKRGGFKLPATLSEAIRFIQQHGPMRQFRSQPTRLGLYQRKPEGETKEGKK